MKKKVSLFVVFCMVLGLMASGVAAQDTATVSIGNVEVLEGESANVNVSISETSFAGFQFQIEYDAAVLTPTGITEVIAGEVIANLEAGDGLIQATFARATNISFSGPIFTISFDVDGEVDTVGSISIDGDNDYNKVSADDGTDLDITYAAGGVTVIEEEVEPEPDPLEEAEKAVADLFDEDGNLKEGVTQADIDAALALVAALGEDHPDYAALMALLQDAQDQFDALPVDDDDEDEDKDKDKKHAPTGSEMLPFLLIGGLLAVIGAALILPIRKLRKQ